MLYRPKSEDTASMYNKLQVNREKILRPVLDDLASLRYLQEQGNAERVTITEEIQRLGKQNHVSRAPNTGNAAR